MTKDQVDRLCNRIATKEDWDRVRQILRDTLGA